MAAQQFPESDPRHHTARITSMLNDVSQHLKEDIGKVGDHPQATALFETTREVLQGLVKAYDHYENDSEKAWR